MVMRLKDPQPRNPKVERYLEGDGDVAAAGRWLADLVRATVKDSVEDIYHQMPTWATSPEAAFFAHVSVYTKHASLGFSRGARMDDRDNLFAKSASSTYRAVQVARPGAVPKTKLVRLIKQAVELSKED